MQLFTILILISTFLFAINAKTVQLKEINGRLEKGNSKEKNDQRNLLSEFCEKHQKRKSKQLKNCCEKVNKLNKKEKSKENMGKSGNGFPTKILEIYNEIIEHNNPPKLWKMPRQCRKMECPNAGQCHLKKKEKKGKKRKAKRAKKNANEERE